MKAKLKSLTSVMLLGVLFDVNPALSSNVAEQKFAVVDVPVVVAASKQVQSLKDEQTKKTQELQKWLEGVRADIVNQPTKEEKDKLAKKYDAELTKKKEVNTQEYTKKLSEIDVNITSTIANEAKNKGYDLVLVKSMVLYGGDDITDKIKKTVK